MVLIVSACYLTGTTVNFTINKRFQNAVAGCDKIVIRNVEWDTNTVGKEILKVITGPREVEQFTTAIRFSKLQRKGRCGCRGDLTIDFFRNNALVMTATTHHNKTFRSDLVDYDIHFTRDTEQFFLNLMNQLSANASGLKSDNPDKPQITVP